MLNPQLKAEEVGAVLEYSRARVAVVAASSLEAFAAAGAHARRLKHLLVVDGHAGSHASFAELAARVPDILENEPTHRDDPALWLFSRGTTGRPKAVVQTHPSYANTTELYAKGTMGYRESDVILSVPKLFFGYATGANLFFPFAVGATSVLFPEHPTAELLFEKIHRHRPTILVNVPTMVNQMLADPSPLERDLTCLRFAISAGGAQPPGAIIRGGGEVGAGRPAGTRVAVHAEQSPTD